MTVLEIMIVLAIIGGGSLLVRSGFRMITKADLVDDATEFAAVLKRANQLSIEHGELYRVILDLEDHQYLVEVCQGQTAIMRNEKLAVWALHIWNFRDNPAGTFAMWIPRVSCDHALP